MNCTLYPIPFTNQLKIDCGNTLKTKLILHDILGKQILNTEFTSGEVINIPEFVSSGLYFYEILNGLEHYTGKVMKN